MQHADVAWVKALSVSMKSGLDDRNNLAVTFLSYPSHGVSMKSGLEDRNNE